MLNNLEQMHLKLLQKELFKKQQKQLVIWLVTKLLADRITKVSKTLPQNNSDKITNEHEKYILKERYVSLEERDEIIDELRLI